MSKRERGQLATLEQLFTEIRPDEGPPRTCGAIREFLQTDMVGSWRFDGDAGRPLLANVEVAGVPARYIPELLAGVAAGSYSFLFSLRAPAPAQRDVSVHIPGLREVADPTPSAQQRLGFTPDSWAQVAPTFRRLVDLHDRHGMADLHQFRTLICDGPLVLAYVNALHTQPLSGRQRRLYRKVARLMTQRSRLDHRLAMAGLYRSALDTVLDALSRPAYITRADGTVVHTNPLGQHALDHDPDLHAQIAAAVRGAPGDLDVRVIAARGTTGERLVTSRRPLLANAARSLAMERTLSARATEVLVHVVEGEPNKLIAIRLGVAENTIEYHLTTIFRRFGVSKRTELQRLVAERASR